MSFTNSTPNYGLPQYIGTDKPTYLGDMNTAYSTIDTQMKANADAAAAATSTANTAASAATTAATNATTALNTANSAASEAASASSAAANATTTANNAATDASTALRASAANSIDNLAPAYDPTLTYSVGDLVTYIDENNSGKLYKCIVAVATPEAFNVNKWDDITASVAFQKVKRVYQQEFTANNKMRDVFNWIHSVLDNFTTQEIIESDLLIESDTWSENFWCENASTAWIRYSRFFVAYQVTNFTTFQLDRSSDHPSDHLYDQTLKTTGTNTWTDNNLDTTNALAAIYKIVI